MAAPYLGGHVITSVAWEGPFALRVRFTTTYGTTYCYQVYAGRQLIGWTESVSDLSVMCNYMASDWPEHITLLAVDPAQRSTDYGSYLPDRPYNAVKLGWTTSGWASDSRFIEITSGTTPGGAVDTSNVLANVLFDADRAYTFITDPLEGSGVWNFQIAGRDLTAPDGNRGTAAATSATIFAHPPDVEFASDDYSRLAVTISGSNIVASFTEAAA